MMAPDPTQAPWAFLSPLDAAVFVEHVIAARKANDAEVEVFEGKGGASGGAGASESWDDKPISPPGLVDSGPLQPACVAEWRSEAEAREMTAPYTWAITRTAASPDPVTHDEP